MKLSTWIYLIASSVTALALSLAMWNIGVRCISTSDTVLMCLGWFLIIMGVAAVVGGVWNIIETIEKDN